MKSRHFLPEKNSLSLFNDPGDENLDAYLSEPHAARRAHRLFKLVLLPQSLRQKVRVRLLSAPFSLLLENEPKIIEFIAWGSS